jgi:hypothetical protein
LAPQKDVTHLNTLDEDNSVLLRQFRKMLKCVFASSFQLTNYSTLSTQDKPEGSAQKSNWILK